MKRLFTEGFITTILGIFLIAGGAFLYLNDGSELAAGSMFASGLIFLRSKDSLIKLGSK